MTEPRFSIVIPTHDRPALLRSALATATAQRYADVEIVVSDDVADEHTRRVVDELQDGRVRYVRPPRPLVQADHWEFAVGQARGEWVILYGDDDGVPPSFLDRLAAALEGGAPRLASWASAYYRHPGAVGRPGNVLTVYPFTGSPRRIASRDELERVYARLEGPSFPKFGPNAAVRRDLLDDVRMHAGRLFQAPIPDYTFGPVALALEPEYLFIDQPLAVCGIAPTSIGRVISNGSGSGGSARRLLGGDDGLRHVPLRAEVVDNLCFESVLRAKAAAPGLLDGFDVEPVRYFVACYDQLDRAASDGAPEGLGEWRAALSRQPQAVRDAVGKELGKRRPMDRFGRTARARIRRVGVMRAARRIVRRTVERRSDYRYVLGDEAGFSDLSGGARWLECNVLPPVEASTSDRAASHA